MIANFKFLTQYNVGYNCIDLPTPDNSENDVNVLHVMSILTNIIKSVSQFPNVVVGFKGILFTKSPVVIHPLSE